MNFRDIQGTFLSAENYQNSTVNFQITHSNFVTVGKEMSWCNFVTVLYSHKSSQIKWEKNIRKHYKKIGCFSVCPTRTISILKWYIFEKFLSIFNTVVFLFCHGVNVLTTFSKNK